MTSVIIPFHNSNNIECLKLCLESLTKQETEIEVIIVIPHAMTLAAIVKDILGDIPFEIVLSPEATYYAKKINIGVNHSKGKYILLAQDDIILSEGALSSIINGMTSYPCIVSPLCNSDYTKHYLCNLAFEQDGKQLELKNSYTMDEIRPFVKTFMGKLTFGPMYQRVDYLATYCSFMSREVWNKLGGLDEGFINGKEDVDLSIRANQNNVPLLISWQCFVLHFGSMTLRHEKVDTDHNEAYFNQKYKSLLRASWYLNN